MVIRVSDKKKNYSKVTKLLVKPIKMSLTAIGVGMAALAVIGGGLGIGFATSSAVKAIAQQPEARRKNS